jgi:hypothetical protein
MAVVVMPSGHMSTIFDTTLGGDRFKGDDRHPAFGKVGAADEIALAAYPAVNLPGFHGVGPDITV